MWMNTCGSSADRAAKTPLFDTCDSGTTRVPPAARGERRHEVERAAAERAEAGECAGAGAEPGEVLGGWLEPLEVELAEQALRIRGRGRW